VRDISSTTDALALGDLVEPRDRTIVRVVERGTLTGRGRYEAHAEPGERDRRWQLISALLARFGTRKGRGVPCRFVVAVQAVTPSPYSGDSNPSSLKKEVS
jgi:hypothetical protein